MPVKINTVKVFNEFRSEFTDFALANIGDKLSVEIEFTVSTFGYATTSNPFIARNNNYGLVGDDWLTGTNNPFKGFKIGDTVTLYDRISATTSAHTIIDKHNDNAIRLNSNFGLVNEVILTYNISVTTPITGVRFYDNFVENSAQPTFNDLTTGTQHLISGGKVVPLDAASVAVINMAFEGVKDWTIGGATITGQGISTANDVYESKFKIVRNLFLTPFGLSTDLTNFINGVKPSYYDNNKCLKYILDIEAAYNYADPNRIQTNSITTIKGNSGWFNENFNTALNDYSISNLVYKRADNTTVIDALELVTTEQNVTFRINNTTTTPFSNNNTKIALNFIKLIEDSSEYTNNGRSYVQNFLFDRKLTTVGSAASNGDNFGSTYQVLKDIVATFISSSIIEVTFKVQFVTNVITILEESNTPRFSLFVSTQNHTLASLVSDRVALKIDASEFYIDNSDPTMLDLDTKWLRMPESDYDTEGQTAISVFPEDEVVAYTRMYIDKNGRTTDEILLKNVTLKIKSRNTVSGEEFDLDSFTTSLASLPIVPSGSTTTQFIDLSVDRIFHTTDIRKTLTIKRRTDLDAGNLYYYDFSFPFLVRWEYWEKLASSNTSFFDTAEPLNGLNNFWHRFGSTGDWKLYYEIEIGTTKNGNSLIFNQQKIIESNDYNSNADWINKSIKSYLGAVEQVSGLTKYIIGYSTTTIEAKFTKVSATPVLADIHINMGIEVFEKGGISGRRRLTDVYTQTTDTWFKSFDTSNKVVVTLAGNTITAKLNINNSEIPLSEKKFKITARLYDMSVVEGKNFQNNDIFEFQNNDVYEFQIP